MSGTMIHKAVLRRLAIGPATFSQLYASVPSGYRALDRALQTMRKQGLIRSLPRVRGVRRIAEWALASTPSPRTVPKGDATDA